MGTANPVDCISKGHANPIGYNLEAGTIPWGPFFFMGPDPMGSIFQPEREQRFSPTKVLGIAIKNFVKLIIIVGDNTRLIFRQPSWSSRSLRSKRSHAKGH